VQSDFDALMSFRAEAMKALEIARKEKLIGSGLEAMVVVHAPEALYSLLERYQNDLRFLLIVSAVELRRAAEENGNVPLKVEVKKAPGEKCARCWNYSRFVGSNEDYPTVCERCFATLQALEGKVPA
jgi:isoleucyl-tRNA synthetase